MSLVIRLASSLRQYGTGERSRKIKKCKGLEPKTLNTVVTNMLHMSQNNYSIRLVGNLLKGENHVRGLARDLQTNQTTIARKVGALYKENIVDYKREGKNKVFYLKKTLEAKQYACIFELYKLVEVVNKYPRLRGIFEKIRQNSKVSLAILFGSYAKGTANKDSDIDIYVDTTDRNLKKEIELLYTRLSVKIGAYDRQNLLIREIEKNHAIIKGFEVYYEKNHFFA